MSAGAETARTVTEMVSITVLSAKALKLKTYSEPVCKLKGGRKSSKPSDLNADTLGPVVCYVFHVTCGTLKRTEGGSSGNILLVVVVT